MTKTKTIILGQKKQRDDRLPQPIIFRKLLKAGGTTVTSEAGHGHPEDFKYIELVCRNYSPDLGDVMFVYDDPGHRSAGILFFGEWNDGQLPTPE